MSTSATARLAVLIDADNTSPKHVSALLQELAQYGVATVKRAYGDWTTPQLGGWKTQLNRHAIVPVQQFSYTTGKNATDSALIIDAMDLLYSGNLDAFALVSSDSDFTRLATRLRESGKTVYGLGLRKTPQSLVAAVDTFIYLEVIGASATSADGSAPDAAGLSGTGDAGEAGEAGDGGEVRDGGDATGGGEVGDGGDAAAGTRELPNIQSLLTRAVNATAGDDGWAHLGAIGSYLRSLDSSFDPRLYGHPRLLALVEAQPFLITTGPASGAGTGVQIGLKGQVVPVKKPVSRARKTSPKPSPE